MFGEKIDYWLLRPLTHRRGYATKAELEERARDSSYTIEEAKAYLERVSTKLFDGDFPVDPSLAYLDVGCGMGRLSLGLAAAGASDVTGVEIIQRNVVEATGLAEKLLPKGPRPTFVHADIHNWEISKKFDVIVVLGAMEHIHDQDAFLAALPQYLTANGRCYVSIEPFHSPNGDHMSAFFRIQVPWKGLIFNERAMLRRRTEVFRPDDPVECYEDVEGGLNKVRYRTYEKNVRKAGLEFVANHINPQLAHKPKWFLFRLISAILTRIPVVRDYFIVVDYAVLQHQHTRR